VEATVYFDMKRYPVHLELTAPGVETQPFAMD